MSKENIDSGRGNTVEPRERDSGLHFLIVDDNPENREAAQNYLNQRGNELTKITADFAVDYDDAERRLEEGKYNAVLTDLFFPKKIGSNDITLGQQIVANIEEMASQSDFNNLFEEESSASKCFADDLQSLKEALTLESDQDNTGIYEEGGRTILPSAHNQPLGVLIAEKAKEREIPYAIVTSGHGRHGDMSTPVSVYLKKKGLVNDFTGNFPNRERNRGMSDLVRNGEFLPYEEYEADKLANSQFYRDNPEEIREDYDNKVNSFKSKTKQPYFTDAKKQNPEVWENVIKWTEYVVKQSSEKNTPNQ